MTPLTDEERKTLHRGWVITGAFLLPHILENVRCRECRKKADRAKSAGAFVAKLQDELQEMLGGAIVHLYLLPYGMPGHTDCDLTVEYAGEQWSHDCIESMTMMIKSACLQRVLSLNTQRYAEWLVSREGESFEENQHEV